MIKFQEQHQMGFAHVSINHFLQFSEGAQATWMHSQTRQDPVGRHQLPMKLRLPRMIATLSG